jgi:ABC-type bacteriocin/lantibiotic exporter with double-glycine peptidase domain
VPNTLLPVPHKRQRQDADCLAACAAMVLAHSGQQVDYDQLLKLLQVKSYGTSGRHLKNLTALGVQIIYREGSLDELKSYLLDGKPCIALVRTAELPYWTYSTDHAVVVVGFDDDTIYLNDPAFEAHPQSVPTTAFELAWMEFDYRYGVIVPQS